jgi:carbamoyl-phosphate synthase large subunit
MGDSFEEALLNSLIATGYKIPSKDKGIMLSSGGAKEKAALLDPALALVKAGYTVYASEGTAKYLNENGAKAIAVGWPDESGSHVPNVMDMIHDHKFDLIVNIPKNHTKRELTNGYKIRRGAIDHNIPLITNARLASAFIEAFCSMSENDLQIKSWQDYE